MGDESAHASAHDAVPGWQVHCVKFGFDNFGDVVQHASLLKSEGHAVNRMLLHLLAHVCELNHSVFGLLLVNFSVSDCALGVDISLPFLRLFDTNVNMLVCLSLSAAHYFSNFKY